MLGGVKMTVPAAVALMSLALGAVSVGGTDDDDDCDADECMVVIGTRVTCEGVCIDPTGLIEQQREEELRRRIERENREALDVLMDQLAAITAAEMFVTGILFCVGKHPASGVAADMLSRTTIVLEDLPAGQLGEARGVESKTYFQTVVDLDQARDLASERGAPLAQVVSEIVLHEFVHHEHPDITDEAEIVRRANLRFQAMFGIPGPNNLDYDAVEHSKVPTC